MSRSRWPSDARQHRWYLDGHNVIFADPTLATLQTSDKQAEARRLLEAMLDRLATARGLRITVVYDGRKIEPHSEGGAQGRVTRIFSRAPDGSADDVIVRLANESAQRGEKAAVVTSDRALGRRLPADAICLEPSELFAKLRERPDKDEPEVPEGDFSDIEEHFLRAEKHDQAGPPRMAQRPSSQPGRSPDAIEKKKERGLRKQKRRLEQPRKKKKRRRH